MMNNPTEYPSQITETIQGITFSSAFDSGNLKSVRKESIGRYILNISSDWGINGKTTNYRTWFYFSVSGVSEGELTFVIANLLHAQMYKNFRQKVLIQTFLNFINSQKKISFIFNICKTPCKIIFRSVITSSSQMGLFKDGMQPVFRNCHSSQWERLKQQCQYRLVPEGHFEITFKHLFLNDSTVYFAFFYPWSCEDNDNFLQLCQAMSLQVPDIYYDNSVLAYSKEGRPINLITITNGSSQIKEESIPGLFPQSRPQQFKKQHIFISARVHPGEVPGSFVNNGLMKYLLNAYDPAAQVAREKFVWCIVLFSQKQQTDQLACSTDLTKIIF